MIISVEGLGWERTKPVRDLLHVSRQLLFRVVQVQRELQPRSRAKLDQADSHLNEDGATLAADFDERNHRNRQPRQPCLVRCPEPDRALWRSVWTSRSCPSPRCRTHPWGRGCPWLLSTAWLLKGKHCGIKSDQMGFADETRRKNSLAYQASIFSLPGAQIITKLRTRSSKRVWTCKNNQRCCCHVRMCN